MYHFKTIGVWDTFLRIQNLFFAIQKKNWFMPHLVYLVYWSTLMDTSVYFLYYLWAANEKMSCLKSTFLFLHFLFLVKLSISHENWMDVWYFWHFFCSVCYNKHQFFLNAVNFPGSLIDEINLSRGFVKYFVK